jgi:ankyrin repeat protein
VGCFRKKFVSSKKTKRIRLTKDAQVFRRVVVYNPSVAEKMLKAWPELLETRSVAGETALHWCAIEDDKESIRWLLLHKAKVDTRCNRNSTPLMHAAQLGYLATCGILLSAGASPAAVDDDGNTALHHASRNGHLQICELLIEAGASLECRNEDNERPCDITLPRKRELLARLLNPTN